MDKQQEFDQMLQRRAKELDVPIIPRVPSTFPHNDVVALCGRCGREIHVVDNYCCAVYDCPVQLRVTCAS